MEFLHGFYQGFMGVYEGQEKILAFSDNNKPFVFWHFSCDDKRYSNRSVHIHAFLK